MWSLLPLLRVILVFGKRKSETIFFTGRGVKLIQGRGITKGCCKWHWCVAVYYLKSVGTPPGNSDCRKNPPSGRIRATTQQEDQYMQITSRRDRSVIARAIKIQRQTTGKQVRDQTIRNRLHDSTSQSGSANVFSNLAFTKVNDLVSPVKWYGLKFV